jgi:hypothetical protein
MAELYELDAYSPREIAGRDGGTTRSSSRAVPGGREKKI